MTDVEIPPAPPAPAAPPAPPAPAPDLDPTDAQRGNAGVLPPPTVGTRRTVDLVPILLALVIGFVLWRVTRPAPTAPAAPEAP